MALGAAPDRVRGMVLRQGGDQLVVPSMPLIPLNPVPQSQAATVSKRRLRANVLRPIGATAGDPGGESIAESGVDRGPDSDDGVQARLGSYVRSSQCRIDASNGQSPFV